MERENEIKDDFSKDKRKNSIDSDDIKGSTYARLLNRQEYETNRETHPNYSKERDDVGREKGANETEESRGSLVNSKKIPRGMKKIQKNKMMPKRLLKMAVLFIVFLLAWFVIVQYIAADKYEAVVRVVEEGGKIGVNPLTDRLDYGDLPKGNASTRFVTIENNGSMNIYVAIVKYGGIAELIEVSRNNFVLSSGEKEKLELLLEMPISANKEEYKGKVVIFKLPKF